MKRFSYVVMLLVGVLLFWAFGTVYAKDVKITLLNSKGEIQTQLEQAAAQFSRETPGVVLEVIPCPVGQSPYEKVVAMYASGNAPTIAMLDPGDVLRFREKAVDLTSEKWVADAIDHSLDVATLDNGTVIGFPVTVEGYGLIYNKKVLDKAVGGNFDPKSIRTRNALKALFDKIKASGVEPLVISPLDWSLGQHFLSISYAAQSPNSKEVDSFLSRLKKGQVDLDTNKKINGLLDTFDLMKSYNIDRNDPLAGTYDRGAELVARGKVGMWFMGNWAWPPISEFDTSGGQYGFLPIPISNDANEYGNSQIPVGVTKFFILDAEQNSKEQIAAAKSFLNWLVYDADGQDALVNKAQIIPAFKNIKLVPRDPLAKSILKYVSESKTMQFINTLPPDHWSELGASMQKYLANAIDRRGLLKEIETYWKNVK